MRYLFCRGNFLFNLFFAIVYLIGAESIEGIVFLGFAIISGLEAARLLFCPGRFRYRINIYCRSNAT